MMIRGQARAADPRAEGNMPDKHHSLLPDMNASRYLVALAVSGCSPLQIPPSQKKAAHNVPQNTNPGISPHQVPPDRIIRPRHPVPPRHHFHHSYISFRHSIKSHRSSSFNSSNKANSHLGRVPLKIPTGQDRGRPARDGLAGRLAPDHAAGGLSALPLRRLGLGPGHGLA